jgi:hypothetical protein
VQNFKKNKMGRKLMPGKNKKNNLFFSPARLKDRTVLQLQNDNYYQALQNSPTIRFASPTKLATPKQNKSPKQNAGKVRLPPITVVGMSLTEVRGKLKNSPISEPHLAIVRDGIKIFTNSIEDYNKLKSHLAASDTKFFTHQLREEQTNKFVIHGLPKIDCKELLNELTKMGAKPVAVRELSIKKKQNPDHCVYIVSFLKKDRVTILDLKEFRAISYVRVRWEIFRRTQIGPTQCNKCMRFGHGTSNCHMQARCKRCGEQHATKDCTHLPQQMEADGATTALTIDQSKVKCALCGGNHTANYSKCPKRIEYIKSKAAFNRKQHPKTHQRVEFQPAPALDNFNFPGLKNAAAPAWSHGSQRKIPEMTQMPSQVPEYNVSDDNDLYTAQELMQILKTAISQLARATSKADQFAIVMTLSIQYASNHHV